MTKIINMFGGPGSGKSTLAAGVFYELKKNNVNCELVNEFAKDIVWDGTNALLENQLYIFAEQFRRQWRLINKVDYVITDSPLALSCVYHDYLSVQNAKKNTKNYIESTRNFFMQSFLEFDNLNFVVRRKPLYNPIGRIQTEDAAKRIDNDILKLLRNNSIQFFDTDSTNLGVQRVVSYLLDVPKE